MIAQWFSNFTASQRYTVDLGMDLSNIKANCCQWPRMKFLLPSYSKIWSTKAKGGATPTTLDITADVFHKNSLFCQIDTHNSVYCGQYLFYRGANLPGDISTKCQ